MIINQQISQDEILVRYVFSSDFKNKIISNEKIISKHLYGPLRGGTSLQREKYSNESKCLELGNKIPNKELVGFLLFRKEEFDSTKENFIKSIENKDPSILDTYIEATPLDENYVVREFKNSVIDSSDKGNPSHADIIYLKPTCVNDGEIYEKPNTIIRLFSKKLYLISELIINKFNEENTEYIGSKFSNYFYGECNCKDEKENDEES